MARSTPAQKPRGFAKKFAFKFSYLILKGFELLILLDLCWLVNVLLDLLNNGKKGNYHFLLLNRVDAQNKSIASVSGWVYVTAEL